MTPKETTESVAYLYAVEKLAPEVIAVELDISEITVWRHLKSARAGDGGTDSKPLVKDLSPIFDASDADRLRIQQLVQRHRTSAKKFLDLRDRLQRACPCAGHAQHPLKSISVFESGPGAASIEDCSAWDQAAADFADRAAARVAELLRPARRIGIAWGRTLQTIAERIVGLKLKSRDVEARATVFPVNGDVLADSPGEQYSELYPDQTRLSPSFHAAELARGLNGTVEGALSLMSVPAIVPLKYQKRSFNGQSEADVILQFISEIVGYERIFGRKTKRKTPKARSASDKQDTEPLIDNADALLLAIGSAECPRRYWYEAIMGYIGTSVEKIGQLTSGDIGAVLVPREHLTTAQAREFRDIEKCYTGIKLDHIAKCALRASIGTIGGPGVIAFAVGRSRRGILLECISRGLINHAVIDDDLAESLDDVGGKPTVPG